MSRHIPVVLPPGKLEAILARGASQLRLPLDPQPAPHLTAFYGPTRFRKGFEFYDDNDRATPEIRKYPERHCPLGKRGDLLYVQEAWSTTGERSQNLILKSRTPPRALREDGIRWQPPETMPKELAQYWLKLTGVGIERVRSISKADALAEGPRPEPGAAVGGLAPAYVNAYKPENNPVCYGARVAFQQWWKAVHGPASWEDNVWVWTISFQPTLVH